MSLLRLSVYVARETETKAAHETSAIRFQVHGVRVWRVVRPRSMCARTHAGPAVETYRRDPVTHTMVRKKERKNDGLGSRGSVEPELPEAGLRGSG